MEYLVLNLKGRVRRTIFQGRKHLVAPATLIVPGVLNGSRGPFYYPLEELQKNPDAWNNTPIVVYHPYQEGQPVSARSPNVLENQQIGTVFAARVNGKLSADLYFDEERTRLVDPRVLESLYKNRPMELSTGLHTQHEAAPEGSTFNGKRYTYIARNYRPDHLAILPDQVGACSLEDGCGLNVNADGRFELGLVVNSINSDTPNKIKEKTMDPLTEEQRAEMVEQLIGNCECWDEDDKDVLVSFTDEKLQRLMDNVKEEKPAPVLDLNTISNEELVEEMKRRNKEIEPDPVQNKTLSPEEWLDQAPDEVKTTFRYAHQIEQEQKEALVEKLTSNIKDGADRKIQAERLLQRSIADLKADVELLPEPQPVETVENKEKGSTNDSDSAWLSSAMSKLGQDPEDDPLPLPTINWGSEENKQDLVSPGVTQSGFQDPDKWLQSAPTPIREVVQNAFKSEQREKDEIISQLVANVEDSSKRFRLRDKLELKPLAELREMTELIPKQQVETPKRSNYVGSAAPATNRLSDTDKEDILPLPSMSFDK
jgi:hypothetical protein